MAESQESIPENAYIVINSQVFPIKNNLTKIGRKLDNDLVLKESLVSRHHAEIQLREGQFFIRDLESSSGTFINNHKVKEGALYSGDIILLANVPLMFVLEDNSINKKSDKETGGLTSN
jgi:pSer/pThr/pTyr-binding forkhead associated (FHA) protein